MLPGPLRDANSGTADDGAAEHTGGPGPLPATQAADAEPPGDDHTGGPGQDPAGTALLREEFWHREIELERKLMKRWNAVRALRASPEYAAYQWMLAERRVEPCDEMEKQI